MADAPPLVQALLSQSEVYVPLCTSADGACALHATFRVPDRTGHLCTPRGRQAAAAMLQHCWSEAPERLSDSARLEHVKCSLWSELALPSARKQPNRDREADIFYRHLSSAAQRNIQEHVAEHVRRVQDATANLQRFYTFA